MNLKQRIFTGSFFLIIFGLLLLTTYLCLDHFAIRHGLTAPQGVINAHVWAHSIGLTKEQEDKLEPLESALEKDINVLQMKLAQERMGLCSLIRNGGSNSKDIDDYVARVGLLESQQLKRVLHHLISMRDLLTPEQKNSFFDAVMRDICAGCRSAAGDGADLCGMCGAPEGKP